MENKVALVEYFNQRFYKMNFLDPVEYFPSVTTKLGIVDKPFLARWRGDLGNRECDLRVKESQERGSNIHYGWFLMNTGGAVLYQHKYRPSKTSEEIAELQALYKGKLLITRDQDEHVDLLKLKTWSEAVKPLMLSSEEIVYSLVHKEAGTLDNLMQIEEGDYAINGAKPLHLKAGLYVVDLKTGNVVDDTAFMQISAYMNMLEEMKSVEAGQIVGGLILHTGAKTRGGIRGLATILRTREELDQDNLDYRHASALWLRKHRDDKPDVFEFPELITIQA